VLAIDLGGPHDQGRPPATAGRELCLVPLCAAGCADLREGPFGGLLSEHLKAISQALEAKTKLTTLAIGVNDSFGPPRGDAAFVVEDTRQVLKMNSKNYLQQDLPDHVLTVGSSRRGGCPTRPKRPSPRETPKNRRSWSPPPRSK